MRFHVLGPVEVEAGGRPVPLGGPKPRTLVALLAVHAGRVVSQDQVVDAIWGERPPEQTRAAVYTYVSTLRRALGDVIVRHPAGYVLEVDPEQVDLHAFTRSTEEARELPPEEAIRRFGAALALWRGGPLGGTQGEWAEGERARLEELRLLALQDCGAAHLAAGKGELVVAELTATVAEHPFRERVRAQLMRALHQAGRQADALACYQEGRAALLGELGVEPGPELSAAHQQVLRDPAEAPHRLPEQPNQLPFDIDDFTGRTAEASALERQLRDGARLCVISGKPGVGKSSLATHVAHEVRDHFPEGQLFAALRGVHQTRADPAEVLAGFLRALGVADAAVPAELEERAQLYRTLLADRRVLVVLDDAGCEEQIRPLLPGGRRCAVLVTGRRRLGALGGAVHLHLGVLNDVEALALLGRVEGGHRVDAEPEQARRVVRLCGHLPLAIRIIAARLAARPLWPLGKLAERLAVRRGILHELTLGDLEVRGSLSLSYDGLPRRERVALRRLALLDVSGFGGWLVAPLLDCPVPEAEDVVERLVDAQLVDVTSCGGVVRYQLHDLVRAFARERGEDEESEGDIRACVARASRSWLALVRIAGSRMPHAMWGDDHAKTVPHLEDGVVEELLADPEQWFAAEQTGLVAAVERISELDLTDVATRLAAALCSSRFAVRNMFTQWWRTHNAALGAAKRTGDHAGEARLLAGLGGLRYEQDRFDEAEVYYLQALAAHELSGDRQGQAAVRLSLSAVHRDHGRLDEARAALEQALPDLTEPGEVARAMHGLGRVLTEQGDLDGGLDACVRAHLAYRRLGDRRGEAIALRSIGIVHRAAGRLDEAAEHCERAIDVLRGLGDRLMSAYAVQALAKVRIRQGRGTEVRADLEECLATCNDMDDNFGQALVLRTSGELELAEGDVERARQHLDRSLQWWEALALPVWRARTLRDLAALGRRDAWPEALAIFERHGAREAREGRPQELSSDLLKVAEAQ
ncbi:tetratricopeptide repeat protein [Lentzea tibetensis]|uniref:Tetratricopeptide repeat protein n=1 Tax=Lentzea tibetensis TaxID=2591470 RepID=A0A563EUE6_9PSEU|nr:BTAD domain-containing putative transcriptional regulator [Lentzea tibetensis]TWP51306.1 tetratricopeptide repeat protein [Lentzea tibetensis]